jgi:hypothetical protein
LFGFVDDSHAAAADLADDAKVAEQTRGRGIALYWRVYPTTIHSESADGCVKEIERIDAFGQRTGHRRMTSEELGAPGVSCGFERRQIFLDGPRKSRVVGSPVTGRRRVCRVVKDHRP